MSKIQRKSQPWSSPLPKPRRAVSPTYIMNRLLTFTVVAFWECSLHHLVPLGSKGLMVNMSNIFSFTSAQKLVPRDTLKYA